MNEKSAQRDANTARALAVVRFGHRPPARPLSQTHRQDRLQYTALQLASAQCNNGKMITLSRYDFLKTVSKFGLVSIDSSYLHGFVNFLFSDFYYSRGRDNSYYCITNDFQNLFRAVCRILIVKQLADNNAI